MKPRQYSKTSAAWSSSSRPKVLVGPARCENPTNNLNRCAQQIWRVAINHLMLRNPNHDVFTVMYSRPDGSFDELLATLLNGWARYKGDATWRDELHELGALRTLTISDTGTFSLLGDRTPSDPGIKRRGFDVEPNRGMAAGSKD